MQRLLTCAAIVLVVGLAALGLTSCNKYGLTGHIDSVESTTVDPAEGIDTTTITGWANAADPKFDRYVKDAVIGRGDGIFHRVPEWSEVVFVDGQEVKVLDSVWTDRPDVITAVGPSSWGFEVSIRKPTVGHHEVCVDMVPDSWYIEATTDSVLDCVDVTI